jgi:hypothetical protein
MCLAAGWLLLVATVRIGGYSACSMCGIVGGGGVLMDARGLTSQRGVRFPLQVVVCACVGGGGG